jgi:hypothetical protein
MCIIEHKRQAQQYKRLTGDTTMKAQANLTLAKLVTENYIDSADSSTDLVYFTVDAHAQLDKIIEALYTDKMSAGDIKATHDMVNTHLMVALQAKLA